MVVLLLSLSAVGIQLMLKTSKGDAEVINIAGVQRMPSQKIALFSHHITRHPPARRNYYNYVHYSGSSRAI